MALRGPRGGKAAAIAIAVLLLLVLVVFLRGPYVSNFLKTLVLPELSEAVGRPVMARKISLSLLPVFVEINDVYWLDEEGGKFFRAASVKAYTGLWGLLKRKPAISNVVVRDAVLQATRAGVVEVIDSVQRYARTRPAQPQTSLSSLVIKNAEVLLSDTEQGRTLALKGLDVEAVFRRGRPQVNFTVRNAALLREGKADLAGSASGSVVLAESSVDVKNLSITVGGSTLSSTGVDNPDGTGLFRLDVNLLVETVKQIRDLKGPGYGSVLARGSIKLDPEPGRTTLDLDVKADFYSQTLLEFLRAKPVRPIIGRVSLNGKISGPLNNIEGTAQTRVGKGQIIGVSIESAVCVVRYSNGILSFQGKGKLYGGTGEAEVSFPVPGLKPYYVNVSAKDIDALPVLGLIDLQYLRLPEGKLTGTFVQDGKKFNPYGKFTFTASEGRDDPLGRVTEITGSYRKEGSVIGLTEMVAVSEASRIEFAGHVDTRKQALKFSGQLVSDDVLELTTPRFSRLTGGLEFEGGVEGDLKDPLVSGTFKLHGAALDEYQLGEAEMKFSYRKNLLSIEDFVARHQGAEYGARGEVAFAKAAKLLDFDEPAYALRVNLLGADLEGIMGLHNLKFPIAGMASARLDVMGTGRLPQYAGRAQVIDAKLYGYPVEQADFDFVYDFKTFSVMDAVLMRGGSVLKLDGKFGGDGAFKFNAASKDMRMSDLLTVQMPLDYLMDMRAEGRGTIEAPEVVLHAELSDGNFRGTPVLGGTLDATVKGREMNFNAVLLKDLVSLKGSARLKDDFKWDAELVMARGRYDALLGSFLTKVPEDMMFNVSARASLRGDRKHIAAEARIGQMNLTLFGQSFTNNNEILLTLRDRDLKFEGFEMRSGNTAVSLNGSVRYEESYDLVLEGSSSLAPLKIFSDRINILRGSTRFVFALQGGWDSPEINGGVDILNASFGIKGFPQRLASVNGSAYFDNNVLFIDQMGGKLGGGDIELRGRIRLDGIRAQRVDMDMLLSNVTLTMSEGFVANLGGNLIYRADGDSRLLAGEVSINRASYRDRLEWKSWILKLRRAAAPKPVKSFLDDVKLSVRLFGQDDVVIDNNVATANLKMDLVLRGVLSSPLLMGRVESTEGKLYFRNSEFRLLRGTADFSDTAQADPYVDIVAETWVKGYHIWLTLEGRLEQLDLSMVSDPELEEIEILALLTVGEFGERIEGLEGGIGAAEATSIITGGFQDIVEERLKDLTGISRFSIDPYVSRKTGTVTPRLTVSKQVISDRLYVTYSSAMNTSEEQEIKLEYVINRNISLMGGKDDRGSLGGDVIFRFHFK